MAKIFITGSSDGLGQLTASLLINDGHQVVLHARNQLRANDTRNAVVGAHSVVVGDLSGINETLKVAEQVNKLGNFDAVIHNAGVGYKDTNRITADGLPYLFAVNSLAPYILTCLMAKPSRLVYVSSGLHRSGDPSLDDLTWQSRRWNGFNAYSDSKLHNVILAFAVARKWSDVLSNAIEPGWVPTKMGGMGAPDNLEEGCKTQVWLATGNDKSALVTGKYFFHQRPHNFNHTATDQAVQEKFLDECKKLSGVTFPV